MAQRRKWKEWKQRIRYFTAQAARAEQSTATLKSHHCWQHICKLDIWLDLYFLSTLSWMRKKGGSKHASINASSFFTTLRLRFSRHTSLKILLCYYTYIQTILTNTPTMRCMHEWKTTEYGLNWMDMAIQVPRLMIMKICLTDNTFVCNWMKRMGRQTCI